MVSFNILFDLKRFCSVLIRVLILVGISDNIFGCVVTIFVNLRLVL